MTPVKDLRAALEELVDWLEHDTLEILRDIPRMGITWDEDDRNLLRQKIAAARAALADTSLPAAPALQQQLERLVKAGQAMRDCNYINHANSMAWDAALADVEALLR